MEIYYGDIEWDDSINHDIVGLELIHDALLKALKEVNKRIIEEVQE